MGWVVFGLFFSRYEILHYCTWFGTDWLVLIRVSTKLWKNFHDVLDLNSGVAGKESIDGGGKFAGWFQRWIGRGKFANISAFSSEVVTKLSLVMKGEKMFCEIFFPRDQKKFTTIGTRKKLFLIWLLYFHLNLHDPMSREHLVQWHFGQIFNTSCNGLKLTPVIWEKNVGSCNMLVQLIFFLSKHISRGLFQINFSRIQFFFLNYYRNHIYFILGFTRKLCWLGWLQFGSGLERWTIACKYSFYCTHYN